MVVRRIGVLLHERDVDARARNYTLWPILDVWAARGFEIKCVFGVDSEVEADIWIPHLDLTVVPEEYRAFLQRQPRVVNRNVHDISKRKISRNLVRHGDGYDGPVIVKTDTNSGGSPDQRIYGFRDPPRRFWRRRLRVTRMLDRNHYRIYTTARKVPRAIWRNPALVVERFLPERQDGLYRLRIATFFGSRSSALIWGSPDPIVKAVSSGIGQCTVTEAIVEERRRLGLDYAKLDYVVRDGKAILLDVSTTPAYAGRRLTAEQRGRATMLADGLDLNALASP